MAVGKSLQGHLEGGATTLCRCWRVTRRDGAVFGFTDHDGVLEFDGTRFSASEGMTARAFDQSTGLSIDNSEALGVLSDAGLTEIDIRAGRFDAARVEAWLVNWCDTEQRLMLFRGEMGQIERAGGAFKVELRGLTEALNQPQGQTFQSPCAAILGDENCRVDLSDPRLSREIEIARVEGPRLEVSKPISALPAGWFERGRIAVLSGAAAGHVAVIKHDRPSGAARTLDLWEALPAGAAPGDLIRIEAGCDKRVETCRNKFANVVNFRGFPHLPGDDWLMAYPRGGDGLE